MKISEEQYGFVEVKGTNNAIYTLQTLTERSTETQNTKLVFYRLHQSMRQSETGSNQHVGRY